MRTAEPAFNGALRMLWDKQCPERMYIGCGTSNALPGVVTVGLTHQHRRRSLTRDAATRS